MSASPRRWRAIPRAPGMKPMGTPSKLVALNDPVAVVSTVAGILLASAGCGSNDARSTATSANVATSSSSSAAKPAGDFQLRAVVAVPDNPLTAFDISWVDASSRLYYLADRSNAGVDVVDTRTNQFVRRIQGGFAGADPRGNDFSGPNGGVVIRTTNSMAKHGWGPPHPASRFQNPGPGGRKQPLWVERTGRLYVSVRELDGDSSKGAVAQIDPVGSNGRGPTVTALFPVSNCSPAGLTLGPGLRILVGCADPSRSIILDAKTGAVLKTILDVGGSDEVWFNPGDEHYYLAARNDPSGPSLGIIDADNNAFIAKVPTAFNAHSVAADRRNNHVFVPLTPARAGKNDPDPCVSFGGASFAGRGCIGVYWSPAGEDEEDDD